MKRLLAASLALAMTAAAPAPPTTPAEIIAASAPSEWRRIDPARLLVMRLAGGREALIELAPDYAPNTVANIATLVRAGYFDGLAILRVQDNYVVQWGDPEAETERAKSLGSVGATLPAEFDRARAGAPAFTPLADGDVYAPEVGFSLGMPAARDASRTWLAHCYAMVGVGRAEDADSGNGAELYAVIGHSPRHLDRNVTLVGRVVRGMEHLASLPRGTGPLGFYETPEERTTIEQMRFASDLAGAPALEAMREDSASFAALQESRRNRTDAWTKRQAGKLEICNSILPVRPASEGPEKAP